MTDLTKLAKECGGILESWMTNPPKPAMWHFTPDNLTAFADRIRQDEREGCAAEVPTSWLDPLLTGPSAVVSDYPLGGYDVEKLLQAIASAIRSRKP